MRSTRPETSNSNRFADRHAKIGQRNVQTYKAVCAACHDSGVANAPKVGDKNVWKPLIDEGQVIITAHGYVGVRAMPPKGGKADLSVEHFAEALNYMVNNSGGQWSSPDKPMLAKIHDEIAARQKNVK